VENYSTRTIAAACTPSSHELYAPHSPAHARLQIEGAPPRMPTTRRHLLLAPRPPRAPTKVRTKDYYFQASNHQHSTALRQRGARQHPAPPAHLAPAPPKKFISPRQPDIQHAGPGGKPDARMQRQPGAPRARTPTGTTNARWPGRGPAADRPAPVRYLMTGVEAHARATFTAPPPLAGVAAGAGGGALRLAA
jgi:hypothetical protein